MSPLVVMEIADFSADLVHIDNIEYALINCSPYTKHVARKLSPVIIYDNNGGETKQPQYKGHKKW